MASFNLICMGMMIVQEDNSSLNLIVPTIKGHVRKWFARRDVPYRDTLQDLPAGAFSLSMTRPPNGKGLIELVDPGSQIVLDSAAVNVDTVRARQDCAFITVPMPDVIRSYRGAEVDGISQTLGNCAAHVFRTPTVLYDVAMLCYRNLTNGTPITLTGGSAPTADETADDNFCVNWILYADDEAPIVDEESIVKRNFAAAQKQRADRRHITAVNDYLTIRNTGKKTTLELSAVTSQSDGAPQTLPFDLKSQHLWPYTQLPETQSAPVVIPVCGGGR